MLAEQTWEVPAEAGGERLDRWLTSQLTDVSRARVQDWIKAGHVRVDGEAAVASATVRAGQRVCCSPPDPLPAEAKPQPLPLTLLHEDADLAVVNKAAGMSVHPGAGVTSGTLVNALLHHLHGLSGIGGVERPGIVHRLDKETSGLLVVAKHDRAHLDLARQFAARTTLKIYRALVDGHPRPGEGRLEGAIGRHPVHRKRMTIRPDGRPARTDYRVRQELEAASLVECRLHSGRTHQIRVHLRAQGHGLLGDRLYHPKAAARAPRLMLHAWTLGFHHPTRGEWLEFRAPLPSDFLLVLQTLGGHDPDC